MISEILFLYQFSKFVHFFKSKCFFYLTSCLSLNIVVAINIISQVISSYQEFFNLDNIELKLFERSKYFESE